MKTKHKKSFRNNKFYLYLREINNYFYIRKTIKKQKQSDQWYALKLRSDWIGRIYTVINLRKEDVGEEETVKRSRVFEKIVPINSYLKKLDLHEILYPAVEQLTDRSYLIVYSPLFRTITILRTLKYLFSLTIFTIFVLNYSKIKIFIQNIIEKIF